MILRTITTQIQIVCKYKNKTTKFGENVLIIIKIIIGNITDSYNIVMTNVKSKNQ